GPEVDGDVDRDQRVGDQRGLAGVPELGPGLHVWAGSFDAVEAVRTDGDLNETVATCGLATPGAAAPRLAIRVAIAVSEHRWRRKRHYVSGYRRGAVRRRR